jgi:hypothetical protein
MKIRPVGGEFEFHADGETDLTKLIVAFRNFAKAPKNMAFFPQRKTSYLSAFRNFANAPKNLAFFPQRKTSYLSDSFKWFVFVVETRCVSGGRD